MMRKLIVSMNVTLDGYMSGPHCELDWHFRFWNSEMSQYAGEQLARADTILLGRVTYEAMAQYWPSRIVDMSHPREDIAFAEMMNRHLKIVFSSSMDHPAWVNSTQVRSQARRAITHIKEQAGKDIMVYGSGKLVTSLVKWKLVDEFTLWLHPVALLEGKTLFRDTIEAGGLHLQKTKVFSSGVVVLHYDTSLKNSSHQAINGVMIRKKIEV